MTWALQDAKSRFSSVVNKACESGPQIVTRRGQPVVVMISYADYEKIDPSRETAIDVLLGGPKVDGGLKIERDRSMAREAVFS